MCLNAEFGEVWARAIRARMLPKGVVLKIPAGAKLVMQVHYHKSGKPEVDRSTLAMYYAKEPVEKVLQVGQVANFGFVLKPGEANQEVRGSMRLPVDATLYSMFPHMHMLGKEMKVTATFRTEPSRNSIWINDWDFNWQATYYYKEPLKLPKGTRLEMVALFDNTAQNPPPDRPSAAHRPVRRADNGRDVPGDHGPHLLTASSPTRELAGGYPLKLKITTFLHHKRQSPASSQSELAG